MAESYAPADWKKALTGKQFERSGMQAYGAAKLFNIMLAKEYSKRLKVCKSIPHCQEASPVFKLMKLFDHLCNACNYRGDHK